MDSVLHQGLQSEKKIIQDNVLYVINIDIYFIHIYFQDNKYYYIINKTITITEIRKYRR